MPLQLPAANTRTKIAERLGKRAPSVFNAARVWCCAYLHFAIGNFVHNAISNEDILIHGDGLSVRSYLDQNDLAEWILTICKKDNFDLSVYNIGSDEKIDIKSLANLVVKVSNKNINVKILNKKDNSLKKSVYIPDITKIKNTMNLEIKISLKESIKNMIEHHTK